MRHVLEAQQFTPALLETIFRRAAEFQSLLENKQQNKQLGSMLAGRMLFNIFYEPSTRTRMSFGAAAQHLGMEVITTENAREFSSAAKGETLEDTIRVMCEYKPDVIVLRHFETDAAKHAAAVSTVPIINAGDGMGQHPTQALLDLYTIEKELGRLSDLEVILGGDLLHGRTIRSLSYLLAKFKGNKLTFVSPESLRVGDDLKVYLEKHGAQYQETSDLNNALKTADVVYWTRTQKERFDSSKLGDTFTIGPDELNLMKKKSILMHPLPRVGEITTSVDADPRAVYFQQAGNGMYVRMALIEWVLELLN